MITIREPIFSSYELPMSLKAASENLEGNVHLLLLPSTPTNSTVGIFMIEELFYFPVANG
jgi:hypothetical protein